MNKKKTTTKTSECCFMAARLSAIIPVSLPGFLHRNICLQNESN